MRAGLLVLMTLGLTLSPSLLSPSRAAEAGPADGRAGTPAELRYRDSNDIDPERLRAERRAQAHDIDFYAPYYSIEGGRDTVLFLMNTVSDPISVTVSALGEGAELPLGTYVIDSLQHVEISIRERLAGYEETFANGGLRLSLLGDVETLQGWAVFVEPAGQTFEIPLVSPEEVSHHKSLSYWDTTIPVIAAAGAVEFYLLNTSNHFVEVQLITGDGEKTDGASFKLAPGSRRRVDGVGPRPFGPRGWLELWTGGEPGDVLAVGVLGRSSHGLALPLVPLGEAMTQERYESVPNSWGEIGDVRGKPHVDTWITLFNPGEVQRPVKLEVFDSEAGGHLGQFEIEAQPRKVVSYSLERTIPAVREALDPVRFRVRATGGGVLVRGFTTLPDRTLADLAFFPYAIHPNGTYPLPDPSRYETVTTVENVGYESSRIAAQVYWNGGTYSIGPLEIPPGGSHRFDLDALADTAPPDLLGRTLDPRRPGGVLKWTLRSGSDRLVGRTEVKPKGLHDRFGFSCYGCCWEHPTAKIVPSFVEFTPGVEKPFQVSEVIEDCSGTLGPFPVEPQSLTSPSPFVWNGSIVTSSTAADADLSFETEATEVRPNCSSFLKWLFGFGRAEMCRATFNPRRYDQRKTCVEQTSFCIECRACCNNLYQEKVCKGQDPNLRQTELQGCLTNCVTYWPNCG